MARYVCKHCGMSADSKCAASRSVFPNFTPPEHMYVRAAVNFERVEGDLHRLTLDIWSSNGHRPGIECIRKHLKDLLRHASQTTGAQLFCDHQWRLDAPQCELGCCIRKEA